MSNSLVFLIVLLWFCIYLCPSEGLLCYQCSNIPNTPLYREGCDSPAEDLAVDCKTNWNGQLPDKNGTRFPTLPFHKTSHSFLHSLSEPFNRSTDATTKTSLDWICVNGIALVDGHLFIARGCIWALTEAMKDRCEDIDNNYTVDNITVTKGQLCFCDTNMCNSSSTLFHTSHFFCILLLVCSVITVKWNT